MDNLFFHRSAKYNAVLAAALLPIPLLAAGKAANKDKSKPNVILLLADDMGYGDIRALNPGSQIPTPNMDRLAAEGVYFTEAHSNSSLSTPTRYGIVTGRYCFRGRLKSYVLNGYSEPLLEDGRMTVGNLMQDAGYSTAVIGKWHLGLDWQKKNPAQPLVTGDWFRPDSEENVDFGARIPDGPNQHGFDYSYILPGSLDMCPLVYVENGQPIQSGMEHMDGIRGIRGEMHYGGLKEVSFKREETLGIFTDKIKDYIRTADRDKPFFLFAPSTAPHNPWYPDERFIGASNAGNYGDFVHHFDYTIGEILAVLEEEGLADNTIFILTSDNGAAWRMEDKIRYPQHNANYIFRGMKFDIYDGGHHIPLIVRWPGIVKGSSHSDQLVCLTDFMATLADITGQALPDDAGEDSFSFYPILRDPSYDKPIRTDAIHHSGHGMFALRQGRWKFIDGQGSGGQKKKPEEQPLCDLGQLYDMQADQSEDRNLACEYPEVVARLKKELHEQVGRGYTRPRTGR